MQTAVASPSIVTFPGQVPGVERDRVHSIISRSFDVVLATIALVVLSPLLLIVALLIRLESTGPALFSQTRVGLRGRPFTLWKFRSMRNDAESQRAALEAENEMEGGVTFKVRRDPRITRIGRIIRKLSIDELPQLWNVLIGDMTIVGPRPPIPSEVAGYNLYQRQRLAVKPGLTCLWQVSGRSDIPFDQQVELDLQYIRTRSLRGDLLLMLRTVPTVISGRGAY